MKSKLNWNIITENEKKTRMITFLICVVYNFFVRYTKIKELSDITLGLYNTQFYHVSFYTFFRTERQKLGIKESLRHKKKSSEKNLSAPLTGERVDLKIILHFPSLLLQYLQTSDNKVSVCARKTVP